MEPITLAVDATYTQDLDKDYFIYRSGSGDIQLSARELEPVVLQVGDSVHLPDIKSVKITNLAGVENTIKIQNPPREIKTASVGNVRMNGGFLDEIREPIPVNANATVENGSVRAVSPKSRVDIAKVTVLPQTRVKLAGLRAVTTRKVVLNIAGAAHNVAYIGMNNTIDDTKGEMVAGSNDSIGTYVTDYTGEVWVYNPSTTDNLIVSGCETWEA